MVQRPLGLTAVFRRRLPYVDPTARGAGLDDRRNDLIQTLGRRLTLLLRRSPDPAPIAQGPSEPAPNPWPQIEFVAYAEDCLVAGYVRLSTDRLTDLLNEHENLELVDVFVEELATGRGMEVTEIMVSREELLAIQAVGPRGNQGRRRRMRQHPVAIQVGPLHVRGYLHALPGSDPIASFRRRRQMVPITDAWVEYTTGSTRHRGRVGTLIVNSHLVDWIVEAVDDEVEMPDIPLSAGSYGRLVKDFTGQLHVEA